MAYFSTPRREVAGTSPPPREKRWWEIYLEI
jgi:hypothetical protein